MCVRFSTHGRFVSIWQHCDKITTDLLNNSILFLLFLLLLSLYSGSWLLFDTLSIFCLCFNLLILFCYLLSSFVCWLNKFVCCFFLFSFYSLVLFLCFIHEFVFTCYLCFCFHFHSSYLSDFSLINWVLPFCLWNYSHALFEFLRALLLTLS